MVARPMPRAAEFRKGSRSENRPAAIGRGRPRDRSLLLARIVRWIDEGDVGRSDAVNLDERLFTTGPREVPMRRPNGEEAADRQLLARALIGVLAQADAG